MRPEWILDANLLALFLIGSIDRREIGKHSRFDGYTVAEFDALEAFLNVVAERHEVVVVSPNVWTEVSNLFQNDRAREDALWWRMRAVFEELVGQFDERYVSSQTAVKRHEFRFLGLSDVVLLELASEGATIVTRDWKLCGKAAEANVSILHLAELKASWDSGR